MSSVSAANPGVSNVLQALTAIHSPVLNSQSTVSALNSAPVADIVALSAEAAQLSSVNTLFGLSTSSNSGVSILQALENASTSQSVLGNATPSEQAANAQAALQSELTQLFGTSTTTGTLFSTLA